MFASSAEVTRACRALEAQFEQLEQVVHTKQRSRHGKLKRRHKVRKSYIVFFMLVAVGWWPAQTA